MSTLQEHERTITDLFGQIPVVDLGPYNYWYAYLQEAVYCYFDKRYIASILVSSATVETSLFWEYFRKKHENLRGVVRIPELTLPLSDLFDHFRDSEIPLRLLLDSDEVDFFQSTKNAEGRKKRKEAINRLRYIKTRNKFAHAEIFEIVASLKLEQFRNTCRDFDQPYLMTEELENFSYSQLYKTLSFMNGFIALKKRNRKI